VRLASVVAKIPRPFSVGTVLSGLTVEAAIRMAI
jgi:hypothetical protein